MKFYKTIIEIVSDYDPTFKEEIDELAREAMIGESYCIKRETEEINSDILEEGIKEFFNCVDTEE